jgi:hypothetical protein
MRELQISPKGSTTTPIDAHLPRQRPTMPAFDWGPRKALTELRPRHLHMVEEHGFRRDYDRDALSITSWRIGIGCSGRFENRERWKCHPINSAKS